MAADILAPLLDAGRRAAEVERTRARKAQRVAEYAQTVLTAFREVEDRMVQERKQGLRIESLARQVRLAERSLGQLLTEYLNGQGGFIEVLTALTEEQELRRQAAPAGNADRALPRLGRRL